MTLKLNAYLSLRKTMNKGDRRKMSTMNLTQGRLSDLIEQATALKNEYGNLRIPLVFFAEDSNNKYLNISFLISESQKLSMSEVKRLIAQAAVKVNGVKITDDETLIPYDLIQGGPNAAAFQIGKRKYFTINVEIDDAIDDTIDQRFTLKLPSKCVGDNAKTKS